MSKQKQILILVIVLVVAGLIAWLTPDQNKKSQKVSGIQILTPKGTVIIGRNKYTKALSMWVSEKIGYFDQNGGGHFYGIAQVSDDHDLRPAWSLQSHTAELRDIIRDKALYQFKLKATNKDRKALEKHCAENDDADNLDCHWRQEQKLIPLSLTENYFCLKEKVDEHYGGTHALSSTRLINYDLKKKKTVSFKDELANPELRQELLQQLYQNLKLDLDSDITGAEQVSESVSEIERELTAFLTAKGYSYSLDNICLTVRPSGPYLLFGFPTNGTDSYGKMLIQEIMLNQDRLPKDILKLYDQFTFVQDKANLWVKIQSPDTQWQISQNLDQIFIEYQQKIVTLTLANSIEKNELLGLQWIEKGPSPADLEKYNFKQVKNILGSELKINELI